MKRFKRVGQVWALPKNVVSLEAFRLRVSVPAHPSHRLFYVAESSCRWLALLSSFPFLQIDVIPSLLPLKEKLLAHQPDLIIVDAKIEWDDPIRLIEIFAELLEVPVVMIYSAENLRQTPELLKRGFEVGMHDTVQSPLQRDELWESINVLLKFRGQSFLGRS